MRDSLSPILDQVCHLMSLGLLSQYGGFHDLLLLQLLVELVPMLNLIKLLSHILISGQLLAFVLLELNCFAEAIDRAAKLRNLNLVFLSKLCVLQSKFLTAKIA